MWKALTNWLSGLFAGSSNNAQRGADARSRGTGARTATVSSNGTSSQPSGATNEIKGALPSRSAPAPAASAEETNAPEGADSATAAAAETTPAAPRFYVEHHNRGDMYLEEKERELLARICARIAKGDLELPQLPSTSMAVIDMTSKSSAEIRDIVDLIESDPVLSSELVKTANSALYSGTEAAETISQAVMRLGLRNLRTLMFSLSMRSAVLRDKRLSHYAEEVWRQSYSTASIARAIAKPIGVDVDRAFLLGLLADIGKVSLLAMLRKEIPRGTEVSPVLVGRIFYLFHETAGEKLAQAWNLPADIVAVAGCHHRFEENQRDPKDAALVSMALRLDILLMQDQSVEYRNAAHAPEMDYLKLSTEQRREVLDAAYAAFTQQVPAD
jgi:HD-like signal output (HDOD) protein